MRILVEPACYTWAVESDSVAAYPALPFVDGVMWLESFFSFNPHCHVPMTADLRAAIGRLFPYQAAAGIGRIAEAQELVGVITRMIERISFVPDFEYQGLESRAPNSSIGLRVGLYLDEDVWISWCDLISQCVAHTERHGGRLHGFSAAEKSCVHPTLFKRNIGSTIRWIRGGQDVLPDGTVDPDAMKVMKARWQRSSRAIAWEDSGHQPPISIKRLIARVLSDCEGVIVRFGSTYFKPSASARCGIKSCGTDGDNINQLECTASDGSVIVRGIFRTTAETAIEQATALSLVRWHFRVRCAEAGFAYDP